jgi:hypothetical protein
MASYETSVFLEGSRVHLPEYRQALEIGDVA